MEERYADGELPKSAVELFQAVEENEGIDVKELRGKNRDESKESKNEFDRALIELQSKTDIVIAGISERLNANGTKNGWNSTCYMTACIGWSFMGSRRIHFQLQKRKVSSEHIFRNGLVLPRVFILGKIFKL